MSELQEYFTFYNLRKIILDLMLRIIQFKLCKNVYLDAFTVKHAVLENCRESIITIF